MEQRECTKCGEAKDIDQFAWKNKAAGIKQRICKACVGMLSKQNYIANKDRHVQTCRRATADRVQRIREYLASLNLKCQECGEDHPAVIDFHHMDPTEKESSVSNLVGQGHSLDRIKKEIDKCIVLCSNCHRKLHWKERNMPA